MRTWFTKTKIKMRDWLVREAGTKRAEYILAIISFAESSFFPIPPDFFLIPMILAQREKWLRLSSITAFSSMAGGLFGYLIGIALMQAVAVPLIQLYGFQEEMAKVGIFFSENAFLAVFVSGFSPIPFKVFTIGAGMFKVSIWIFIAAVVAGRGLRFWFEGYIMGKMGERIAQLVFRFFNWGALILALTIVAYIIIK